MPGPVRARQSIHHAASAGGAGGRVRAGGGFGAGGCGGVGGGWRFGAGRRRVGSSSRLRRGNDGRDGGGVGVGGSSDTAHVVRGGEAVIYAEFRGQVVVLVR
eukprot:scaffold21_cov90-Isochrysis_galbana.AAC.3